jgi:hypothetical protein
MMLTTVYAAYRLLQQLETNNAIAETVGKIAAGLGCVVAGPAVCASVAGPIEKAVGNEVRTALAQLVLGLGSKD